MMPLYAYTILTAEQRRERGTLTAENPYEGRRALRGRGCRIVAFETARLTSRRTPARLFARRRHAQVAEVARYTVLLLRAGVPIAECLDSVARQQRGPLVAVLRDLRDRIHGGATLADALGHHPQWFDALFVHAARLGDLSGNLDDALGELATYLQTRQTFAAQIRAALTYPLILMWVGMGVVIFLMSHVVPQLLTVLDASGQALPTSTRILQWVSGMAVTYGWLLGLAMAALGVLGVGLYRHPRPRFHIQRGLLRLPLLGPLLTRVVVAQFAQHLGTLLRTGSPFVDATRAIARFTHHQPLAQDLEQIASAIESGSDIAPAMTASRLFPPVVVQLMQVGQDSGELTALLGALQVRYEEEARVALQRFTAALEPLLIVGLAAVVGFVVVACMTPILEVTRGIA